MKISVDGGGLCADIDSRYGTHTFSENLIRALNKYDRKNNYYIYSFCKRPLDLELSENSCFQNLQPKKMWMKMRVSIEEFRNKKDIFLALNQALPVYTDGKIISFSHGLSYHFFPGFYKSSYSYFKNQLNDFSKRSKFIVVSSKRVRQEFLDLERSLKDKIVVIPFGIPFDHVNYTSQKKENYFLHVGMDTPIKNVAFLIKAFKEFNRLDEFKDFKLYLVGPRKERKSVDNIVNISNVNHSSLKEMYAKATGYLTASYYESFNFPVLEALSQNCQVVGLKSAIIPELDGFVNLSKDKETFVVNMIKVAKGKYKQINRNKLKNQFSWKNYVEKLVSLY